MVEPGTQENNVEFEEDQALRAEADTFRKCIDTPGEECATFKPVMLKKYRLIESKAFENFKSDMEETIKLFEKDSKELVFEKDMGGLRDDLEEKLQWDGWSASALLGGGTGNWQKARDNDPEGIKFTTLCQEWLQNLIGVADMTENTKIE